MNPINDPQIATTERPGRRGVLTIEMLLVLPIVLVVLFALIQFAFILQAYQSVAASASVAVRQGVLPSADRDSVVAAAHAALSGWKYQNDIGVLVYVDGVQDDGMNDVLADAVSGQEVTVEVLLRHGDAAPDLLKFIGLSLSDMHLVTTYTMRRE